jgi:DNA-binding Xre family transcriptional regulator
MKNVKNKELHFVVDNLIKIMNDRKLKKVDFANIIGFPEAKWNKISNGKQLLNVDDLSKIARNLGMREIDILTYPLEYVESLKKENAPRTLITVELKEELKEDVLSRVLGKNYKEILK